MVRATRLQRAVLSVVLIVVAGAAGAHGAGYREWPDDARVLRFAYNTGEAIADTDVVLTAPDGSVRQRGRTDTDGRYAFVADAPGTWSARVDDGLGHEVDARIAVGVDGRATVVDAATPVAVPHALLTLLLAVSVTGNVLLALAMRRRRGGFPIEGSEESNP
jgi:hypothetical protein